VGAPPSILLVGEPTICDCHEPVHADPNHGAPQRWRNRWRIASGPDPDHLARLIRPLTNRNKALGRDGDAGFSGSTAVVERRIGPSQLRTGQAPRVTAVFGGTGRPRGEDRFAVVKVRFELPPGAPYYRTSKAFPELVAEVTAASHLPNGLDRVEMDIIGSPSPEILESLHREPGVISVSRVATLGPLMRNHMVAQTPPFYLLEKDLAILVRYPIVVQDGTYTLEAAGRVSQLREMVKKLGDSYQGVEVLRFGPDRMRTVPESLTPQQDALLHQALAAGYFDVPRRVTLTGLAQRLGKSKSSLSRGLAVVEQKLAESAAATPR